MDRLESYNGEVLLVGINYDKDDKEKKHSCVIEKWIKSEAGMLWKR